MTARTRKLLASTLAAAATMLFASSAWAQSADSAAMSTNGWIALAAGLGIGVAAFGGALGQGRTAASALDGIARNPSASGKIFTPMILGLALIESLVIYSLIISILLLGKIR